MYENCPKKFYHIRIGKDAQDSESEAGKEGKRIHDVLHRRVRDNTPLPLDLAYMEPIVKSLTNVKGKIYTEIKLAVNRNYKATGWFSDDVYWRSVLDFAVINGELGLVVDYKTGKMREDYEQLMTQGAALFALDPKLQQVKTTYFWTGNKKITKPLVMQREDVINVWNDLKERTEEIEEAIRRENFPAQPNPLCRYCPVTQCPHNTQAV